MSNAGTRNKNFLRPPIIIETLSKVSIECGIYNARI
jgi:hypothetical protein